MRFDVVPKIMKTTIPFLLSTILMVMSSVAGLPEIKGMGEDEQITVSLMYSEPAITEYEFVFKAGSVTIRENGKLLGKLNVSQKEASKIDHFLYTVRRAKQANRRSVLGAPVYQITHHQSGQRSGEWRYRVDTLKTTTKPTLSMRELLAKVKKN